MKKFKKIYIEITNKCNLKCKFCSIDTKSKREMSLNEFENILIKINDYTDYVYLHVKGEPLIHSHFKEVLMLCKKYNKQVNITTNGTLLSKKTSVILDTQIVRQINISLQSLTNDKYLADILNTVKFLLDNSDIQLVLRFWALNDNKFTTLEENFIKEITTFFNINQNIIDEIYTKQNVKLQNNLYLNKEELFEWPNLNSNYYNEKGTCLGLKTHIGILSDGTVIPCCLDNNGDIPLGNIFEDTIEEILEKPKSVAIKKNFENGIITCELCKTCGFLKRLESKRK